MPFSSQNNPSKANAFGVEARKETKREAAKRSFRKRKAEGWALGVTKGPPERVVLVVFPQRGKNVGNSVTSNFFRSLSQRRCTQRSSAERRHHAAIQVTKLRSVSPRTISSRAVRHDSGVLSHHARMEDRQRLVLLRNNSFRDNFHLLESKEFFDFRHVPSIATPYLYYLLPLFGNTRGSYIHDEVS
ncbi:predicted protein [Micromonas commoda]|uniref:Uncharacterized protein n=1 Tax=Micromonas commoda (strain RCC299 / NOUM17 / CCMP2709) TaxID=296587 RepID=C1FEN9_MICCC|nr:predicted protein [Micromonas commoda]ACO68603.1 predicted protein [Micromonas commoda]|eukprot:XP_002507345.1 predicted protein [Micromonas commoda]